MIGITIAAEAEKNAAEDKASAIRTLANANADQRRIEAQADSDSEKLRADAAERRYVVDAEGQRLLNDAANMLSVDQIALQIKLAVLRHLPDIIRESVKPMEAIDGIKIVQIEGLQSNSNHGGGGESATAAGNGNLADQVVSSALRYRAQAPLIESLMKEVGISGGDLNSLTQTLSDDSATSIKLREALDRRSARLDEKT